MLRCYLNPVKIGLVILIFMPGLALLSLAFRTWRDTGYSSALVIIGILGTCLSLVILPEVLKAMRVTTLKALLLTLATTWMTAAALVSYIFAEDLVRITDFKYTPYVIAGLLIAWALQLGARADQIVTIALRKY